MLSISLWIKPGTTEDPHRLFTRSHFPHVFPEHDSLWKERHKRTADSGKRHVWSRSGGCSVCRRPEKTCLNPICCLKESAEVVGEQTYQANLWLLKGGRPCVSIWSALHSCLWAFAHIPRIKHSGAVFSRLYTKWGLIFYWIDLFGKLFNVYFCSKINSFYIFARCNAFLK